jgi:hypothetical protein
MFYGMGLDKTRGDPHGCHIHCHDWCSYIVHQVVVVTNLLSSSSHRRIGPGGYRGQIL